MTKVGHYNLCITPRHDHFSVGLEQVSKLIDFLDARMYLDGPDKDHSRLVVVSQRETHSWKHSLREDPESPVQSMRRRHVHVLHSPAAPEENYRNYSELLYKIENLMPRDTGFVASLGYGTRNLYDTLYSPFPNQERRWIDSMLVHVIRGPHPIWRRVWDEQHGRKEWQILGVKAFTLMITCKLNMRVESFSIEEYIEVLRLKHDFISFLSAIGSIIGTKDFELLGGTMD